MSLVTVNNNHSDSFTYYTYDTENILSERLGIEVAYIEKRNVNGLTSDVIIQVCNISRNVPDSWFHKNFQAILHFSTIGGNFIELFSDKTQNEIQDKCNTYHIYIIRKYDNEITLADLLYGNLRGKK